MSTILFTKDSKNKFRMVEFDLEHIDKDDQDWYIIHRKSGLVEGKLTTQPDLEIKSGKVKRTVKEQAELQLNSLIKHQLDKGYKNLADYEVSELTQAELAKIMPDKATDQNGVGKPMLCKVFDFEDKKNFNKDWYISRKHDGVRCFLYYKDGEIKTSSRGGQDYDVATTYIRQDAFIKSIFELNPDIILDGEIYRHGWPLAKISGLCRLDNVTEEHKELKFHCYDIADESKTFKERLKTLNTIKQRQSVFTGNSLLVIVDHYLVSLGENGSLKDAIMNFHNTFIKDGYEGAVVRDGDEVYKFGARDRRMQKIKLFTDGEFKIKDLVEGLREEDMCFLLETKEGYEFKAKPIGTREEKQWYRQNIQSIKGCFGTVKYFGFTTTDEPVPNLPVFKCVRSEKDI